MNLNAVNNGTMIVPVYTNENKEQVVSARELHSFLDSKKDFSNWLKHRIKKYEFVEGVDFTPFGAKSIQGRPRTEYAISLDMAKELSMLEANKKGKQARQYFINLEKKAKEVIMGLSHRVSQLENRTNRPSVEEWQAPQRMTIFGWARWQGEEIKGNMASLGKRATALCKANKLKIGKSSHPTWGYVNTYPIPVLKALFSTKLSN